ncbi:hypothetical protein LOCC1_G003115 [Lachnellula occidentalis]|uniref:Protein kinase domain-containing protein n=1 Tax=Lachnellula occidentalis TaxID=215460 RepID=A0A8H8UHN0_9HELO|nr:hypothetical protein LOCC1_G003115 [Lachnellula occidentalis]
MDPISGTLIAVKVLVVCISHANTLAEMYRAFANTEQEMTEVTLQLEGFCLRMESQLEFMNQVWAGLHDVFQMHQVKTLSVLEKKLQAARDEVSSLIEGPKQGNYFVQLLTRSKGLAKRLKYTTWAQSSLRDTMHDLDTWWKEFDMSWYMMARISSRVLDEAIRTQKLVSSDSTNAVNTLKRLRNVTNHESRTTPDKKASSAVLINEEFPYQQAIPFCSAFLTFDPKINDTLLLDTIVQNTLTDYKTARRDIESIAVMLQAIEPVNFGLVRCHGVAKSRGPQPIYQFAFIMPSNCQNPRSLRDLLIYRAPYTLNQRLQLARQMSRAIMLVHASSFVHKNIRPETIIAAERKDDVDIKWPFLIGFERFRLAEGKTFRTGDDSWEKNLYRHPNRQGVRPDEDYMMQHDIYSLGINLFEIGIWQSLLRWSETAKSFTPQSQLEIDIGGDPKRLQERATRTKKILITMAREILPQTMGQTYSGMVVSCLTCLDNSGNSFGDEDELDDDDGILVGIRYIEKIWAELQKIHV